MDFRRALAITEKLETRSGIAVRLNAAKAAPNVAERQNPVSVLAYSSETNAPLNTTAGRAMNWVGLAGLLALIASAGLAIALERADRRLKTVQEADELLPARVVAAIPQARDETPSLEWARLAERCSLSPQSEAYRFLGQHVLSAQNRRFRSLMALSTKAGKGNTRMMYNLAITLAQAGQRVILVDANLRHPMLHKVFDLRNDTGPTEVLEKPGVQEIEEALQLTPILNLRVLTSGAAISNPWELFSSHRIEEFNSSLRSMADYVLFDTPSALAYTDTLSLSSIADAALLCARAVDPITGAEHRLGEMFVLSDVQNMGSVLMDAPPALIGSYERELHDTVPSPAEAPPALEAGEMPRTDHSPPIKDAAITTDTLRAEDLSIAADTAPPAKCANVSEEEPMDPAFEVTETRLAMSSGRSKPAEEAELFEIHFAAAQPQPQVPEVDFIPARAEMAVTEAGVFYSDTIREEIAMASANETPPGGFPKSIHGYNVRAVDDYVRKINSRLEVLLSQVQSESVRADQSKRLLEQMTSELETIRRRASEAAKREMAAIEGQKRSEEEAARLVQDLKGAREKVRGEPEAALVDARQERNALRDEERQDAEAMVAEARRSAEAQVAEANQRAEVLRQQAVAMSAEIESLRAQIGGGAYSDMVSTSEAHSAGIGIDRESQQSYARSQIDLVVNEARRSAEDASARIAAVYRDHEDQVRALSAECEALVQRIRDAVEMQLSQLPALPVRSTVGVGRQILRNEEPEEKRTRDNREWRTGDWRNAS